MTMDLSTVLEDTESFEEEARRLRRENANNLCEFFLLLMEGEKNLHIWRPHAPTFDAYLSKRHVCKPSRYRNAVAAFEQCGTGTCRLVGLDAALKALRIMDLSVREKALAEMHERATEHGAPIPSQSAERIVCRYQPALKRPSKKSLEQQIRELKETIRQLQAEIVRRDAKIELLLGLGLGETPR